MAVVVAVAVNGAQGSETVYFLEVPAGKAALSVVVGNGASGDANLRVVRNGDPTSYPRPDSQWTSEQPGSDTITIDAPVAGTYFVNVIGMRAYAGWSLTATLQ